MSASVYWHILWEAWKRTVPSPLSIAIVSSFDEGTLAGTLTITVTLDGSIAPPSGTVNIITVFLYERGLESRYGTDAILYPQVIRAPLLTEQVTVTDAGQQQTFTADYLLDPVEGYTNYNHLSVRSAAAIILDRLAGR